MEEKAALKGSTLPSSSQENILDIKLNCTRGVGSEKATEANGILTS